MVEYQFFKLPRENEFALKNCKGVSKIRARNVTDAKPRETTFGLRIGSFEKIEG